MLILFESRIKSEHHVQRLNQRIVDIAVNRDIQDIACYSTVISQGKVDIFTWSLHFIQKLFDFGRPDLHERVDVWHSFGVAD